MKNYCDEYHGYCSDLNRGSNKEDIARHNKAMAGLAGLFHEIEGLDDRSFLLDLLKDKDGEVRLQAAAHCLGLNEYVGAAKRALRKLGMSKNRVLAFNARSVLKVWKEQGCLRF